MKDYKNKIILIVIIVVFSIIFFVLEKFIDSNDFDVIAEGGEEAVESIEDESSLNNEDSDVSIGANESEKVDFSEGDLQGEDDEVIEESEGNKIYVYVTGEVNNCGVVILNEGSRIVDAINAAGGTTDKADVSKVNLVYVLEDGMKVNIPSSKDLKENSNFDFVVVGSGDGSSGSVNDSEMSKDDSAGGSSGKKNIGVVNINIASQTELESLPGIGPSLALKIIKYRNEVGKFSSVEDIKNVSGIGDSKFDDIKEYICVK